ncbi:hypothetical protein A3F06_04470 [candidate division TM6 bacterium RIFCSPHIGHO2_12_FULL_36_22]|nr:MAG: hypothetical protein A3F06_04470 [candidate division TM6 bacterium RIFCSPHIGHO2_12_FULL_36_22]
MVYRILIVIGLLCHAQSYADSDGFTNDSAFYSGDLAGRQSSSTQSFIQGIPQKDGGPQPFIATITSAVGAQAKITNQPTKYYLFPMQVEKDQHIIFTGKLEGSDKVVTLKDTELINKVVNQQIPIINGKTQLFVGKEIVMELTFEGNVMKIKELPDDLLPTQQICEADSCCLKINLSLQTPGTAHNYDVNLFNGVCPEEEAHPKQYFLGLHKTTTLPTPPASTLVKKMEQPKPINPFKQYEEVEELYPTGPYVPTPKKSVEEPANPFEQYKQKIHPTGSYQPITKDEFWSQLS